MDLSKRKILKPKVKKNLKTTISKESTKINDSSQNLNINNNHVINDNKLNKDEEIKNYIDKNKYKINKESNMCDDKIISVNNKNNIIDNNIKRNKNFKSRNDNNVSTKFNNIINEDRNNYIENLNESLYENKNYVEKASRDSQSNNKNRNNFKNSNINNLQGTVINKKVDIEETKLKFNEQEGNTKPERHINLAKLTNMEPYEIIKDLANTKCNITFGQILDICPKLRSELTKNLKLEKIKFVSSLDAMKSFIIKEEENNQDMIKNTKFHSDDLGIVNASVDDTEGRLLIDSGSNLNLVSTIYINSLPGTYEQVNVCRGRIYEALGDSTIANAIVVRLKVSINNYTFTADFCVIDHKDIYFDFLLGLKSIADNYLFIHPMLRSLCRFTSVENFDIIAPIVENQAIEKNSCGINFIRPNKNNEENSIKEISKKKEVASQEGKNKDLRKKDIMKSKNFNKSEKLKISNAKIPKVNLDNKIENFKISSKLKILREKARYIENPKIMENSKNLTIPGDINHNKNYYNKNIYRNKLTNSFDNILEYNNNMKSNTNCNKHIQEINQNKLKKFLNQLIQLKSNIIEYNNNILNNINSYILQYNERGVLWMKNIKLRIYVNCKINYTKFSII